MRALMCLQQAMQIVGPTASVDACDCVHTKVQAPLGRRQSAPAGCWLICVVLLDAQSRLFMMFCAYCKWNAAQTDLPHNPSCMALTTHTHAASCSCERGHAQRREGGGARNSVHVSRGLEFCFARVAVDACVTVSVSPFLSPSCCKRGCPRGPSKHPTLLATLPCAHTACQASCHARGRMIASSPHVRTRAH
jgi:hypothetical protein